MFKVNFAKFVFSLTVIIISKMHSNGKHFYLKVRRRLGVVEKGTNFTIRET